MTHPILIVGNWKMNGDRAMAQAVAAHCAEAVGAAGDGAWRMVICPPAPLIAFVAQGVAGAPIDLGGQDCHFEAQGAHTGDVSARILADLGCGYVIVGHSERRADHRETDALISAKAGAAAKAGLTPVICVGETLGEREDGKAEAQVRLQLEGSIPRDIDPGKLVIAYEPVWAIGTGRSASRQDIEAMHGFIRRSLRSLLGAAGDTVPILYGGSVKPNNAADILATAEVGGVLVGGASLSAEDFLAIAEATPPKASQG